MTDEHIEINVNEIIYNLQKTENILSDARETINRLKITKEKMLKDNEYDIIKTKAKTKFYEERYSSTEYLLNTLHDFIGFMREDKSIDVSLMESLERCEKILSDIKKMFQVK
jgi:hypothetical protein